MGTLRGDNGGERPPDGGGLPDLPPEWGPIIIPDDAAELDHEATVIRRQMRRAARRNRWRRRFGLPPVAHRRADDDAPTLGLPLLIMSIAIIATLTSLFAIAWPSKGGQPARANSAPPVVEASPTTLVADVALIDPHGSTFRLRTIAPAVVLLVDGCPSCTELVANTSVAVSPSVTVLAVARASVPTLPSAPPGHQLRAARDADGTLRATYAGSPPAGGVTALVIRSDGALVDVRYSVKTVDDLRSDLANIS